MNILIFGLVSYLLGTIMTGLFVTKFYAGVDIRDHGSGNIGARNTGRIVGKKGFILTFCGDALKGAVVVGIAKLLSFSLEFQLLCLLLVVIGHIWPITLRFKGGKGISTLLGGLIVFDELICLLLLIFFFVCYLVMRSFTLAGLGAISLLPLILLFLNYSILSVVIAIFIVLIIIFAHRDNISLKWEK
ncbi:glycerol-3-phosphate acyltransferase [Bacillus sp. SCS-151]|uniref:glycerol-3-phosphate acyltransferase n=1 Tax=Nanhaiella sioensis TaxID=3115293 RepID=UPI00397E5C78